MWLGWCVCTVKNWIWWHVVEKFRHCAWCHKCPWLQKRDLLSCRDPSMICTVVLLQQFAVTFFFHYFGFSFCKRTFSKLCWHGHKLFGLGCHKDAVGVSPVCLVRNNEHFWEFDFLWFTFCLCCKSICLDDSRNQYDDNDTCCASFILLSGLVHQGFTNWNSGFHEIHGCCTEVLQVLGPQWSHLPA